MASDEDHDRIEKVAAFVNDKRRFHAVVASVNRMLRFNLDGTDSTFGRVERAETAEDVVSALVTDAVCGGPRVWDPNRTPSFEAWIFSQARSSKYNLDRKQRRLLEIANFERDPDRDTDTDSPADAVSSGLNATRDIPEPASQDDGRVEFENDNFIRVLVERLEERPFELSVFDYVRDGKSNSEIASTLKIDAGEVRNAKKRIKRIIDRLLRGAAGARLK